MIKNIIILSLAGLFLANCSSKTKNTLGLTENLPDEYQVTKNQSLEVPPHLRTPLMHND
jgi:hypothetical protein